MIWIPFDETTNCYIFIAQCTQFDQQIVYVYTIGIIKDTHTPTHTYIYIKMVEKDIYMTLKLCEVL